MGKAVLFVCLGNICRSPLAEAVFRGEVERLGLDILVDSAGIGDWHIGHPPDHRAVAVAEKHGIDISHLRARQVHMRDFMRFDYIIALDTQNLADLERLQPEGGKAQLSMLLDHVEGKEGQAVADPYYGGDDHFDMALADIIEGAKGFAHRLARQQREQDLT